MSNNQVRGSGRAGISLEPKTVNGSTFYPEECEIRDNRIFDFGKVSDYSRGIWLVGARRCWVTDNIVDGNNNSGTDTGIREEESANYNRIYRNEVRGITGTTKIRILGANTKVSQNKG